jgi:hypothetical protein
MEHSWVSNTRPVTNKVCSALQDLSKDRVYKAKGDEGNPYKISTDGLFGIEVEVENAGILPETNLLYWSRVPDHSLRNNGLEFVSSIMQGPAVLRNVEALFKSLPPEIDFNERAGIHVHVNCRGMTVGQIQTALVMYYLIEDTFFSLVAEHRRDSNFCVSMADCKNLCEYLTFCDTKEVELAKYAALNIIPLTKFGTIEFRHMDSNNDIPRIMAFVKLIDLLIVWAKQWKDVNTFLNIIKPDYGALVKELHSLFGETVEHYHHYNSKLLAVEDKYNDLFKELTLNKGCRVPFSLENLYVEKEKCSFVE